MVILFVWFTSKAIPRYKSHPKSILVTILNRTSSNGSIECVQTETMYRDQPTIWPLWQWINNQKNQLTLLILIEQNEIWLLFCVVLHFFTLRSDAYNRHNESSGLLIIVKCQPSAIYCSGSHRMNSALPSLWEDHNHKVEAFSLVFDGLVILSLSIGVIMKPISHHRELSS